MTAARVGPEGSDRVGGYIGGAGPAMITVCSVAAVCIIFAFPAWKILGLWLEQEISAAEFIIAMGVLVVFMLGIVRTWGEPEGILLWLLMILLGVAIALGTRASSKRRVKQFFNADVAAAEGPREGPRQRRSPHEAWHALRAQQRPRPGHRALRASRAAGPERFRRQALPGHRH